MIIYAVQVHRQSFILFMMNSWADGQLCFSAQQIQLLDGERARQHFEAEGKP